MYLISVYFDDNANKTLQRFINKLSEKTGNHFMTENYVPPHMTVSSIEARGPEVLLPAFKELQGTLKSGEIQFVSVGEIFPYVIYATPVLNEYLSELSEQIFEKFQGIPETTLSRFYKPYSWLPHVTLGKTLKKGEMQAAFGVMQEVFTPFKARVTEIGLAKVNPHEDVMRFKLT